MADLFQVTVPTVNEHLKKLYAEDEVRPEATLRQYLMVRREGRRQVNRHIDHYNLDVILAMGYRVRSQRGTQFRRWATERLREYLVKGFTLDDERLKSPSVGGRAVPDRFDELLERIRDIRASERRMYLRVREIFAMAADYAPSLPETTKFFQFIQNKLHFAVTGKTAAELIAQRADGRLPNMGRTTWKSGSVQKAEARRRKEVFLRDWTEKLDAFLEFNERDVLRGAGHVSREQADTHAEAQYEAFSAQRRAMLEAEGEEASLQALEAAAKALQKPGKT